MTIISHLNELEEKYPHLRGKILVDFLENQNGRFIRFRARPHFRLVDLVSLPNFTDSERLWKSREF